MRYVSYIKAACSTTRLWKFLMVGMLNTMFGYSIFLVGLQVGLHYSVAIALATVLGTLFNFKSIGSIVFQSHDNALLMRFIIVYSVVYILNVAGVALLTFFGLLDWLAGFIVLLPLAVVSYFLNSRYVFSS